MTYLKNRPLNGIRRKILSDRSISIAMRARRNLFRYRETSVIGAPFPCTTGSMAGGICRPSSATATINTTSSWMARRSLTPWQLVSAATVATNPSLLSRSADGICQPTGRHPKPKLAPLRANPLGLGRRDKPRSDPNSKWRCGEGSGAAAHRRPPGRRENLGRPCRLILDCWWEQFEVRGFLAARLPKMAMMEVESAAAAPPPARLLDLLDLVQQAKERSPTSQRNLKEPPARNS